MKVIIKLSMVCALAFTVLSSNAQVPNGSIAKDFTLDDINGVTHNLYSYLNAGKIVYIDFSATWCGPCWSYHKAGSFKDLYNQHGPNGTLSKNVIVLFIEVDHKTGLSDLKGITSAGAQPSQGDWLTGEPYPFIDLAGASGGQVFNDYMIKDVPAIYRICPDKKMDYLGFDVKTAAQLYTYISTCATLGIEENENQNRLVVHPNPAIDFAMLSFNLTEANPVSVSVSNSIGQKVLSQDLGRMPAGSQEHRVNTASLSNGLYFVTIQVGETMYTQKLSVNK